MKLSMVCLLGFILVATIFASEKGLLVYGKLKHDPEGRLSVPRGSNLKIVTPDIRDEVIMYLRRGAEGADAITGRTNYLGPDRTSAMLLIRLGDEQQMKKAMDRYRQEAENSGHTLNPEPGIAQEMTGTGQPLMIPLFAPDFFRNDGDHIRLYSDGDMTFWESPLSISSIFSTLSVIQKSSEFSNELRGWARAIDEEFARRLYKMPPHLGIFKSIMQQWWRENEKHFAAKDYAAVKPGAPVAETLKPAESPAEATPKAAAEVPVPPAPASPPTVVQKSPSNARYYIVAVILSVLALAAIVFVRKKADKRV